MRRTLIRAIPLLIIGWAAIMLLALRFGFLNGFFYSAANFSVQGVDFFSLPKAFLNLLRQQSMYDSWGGIPYGPYHTWFLAHPAFGLFVGFWFSFFAPWASYWLFVLFSLALLAWSARLIAAQTADPLRQRASYLLILCSFPTFWLLYTGNIQAVAVLGFALILTALFSLTYRTDTSSVKAANIYLLAGLLISFFSKPFALLYLPALLINRATRRTAIIGLVIYFVVSALFIFVPVLNPEAIKPAELFHLALNPQFVKDHLNIYANNFVVNKYMKDNSIHWFNLVAQSDHYWNHVDIFSLAAFTNNLIGRILPGIIFKLPLYLTLLLSLLLIFIKQEKKRSEILIILVMALTLTFFLSYNTVWEYQYTLFLPAVALLPLLYERKIFFRRWIPWLLAISGFLYLPTLYFLLRARAIDGLVMTLIRLDKVVPALLLFLILIILTAAEMVKAFSSRSNPS